MKPRMWKGQGSRPRKRTLFKEMTSVEKMQRERKRRDTNLKLRMSKNVTE